MVEQLIFLPGASGDRHFWAPVANQLREPDRRLLLGWPGFGSVPSDPSVNGLEDLAALVARRLGGASGVVAQSMGGVVAILVALAHPDAVERLVLVATSGGLGARQFDARDWRAEYRLEHPQVPDWFFRDETDLSSRLAELRVPTLLVFGDRDPIAPVQMGRHLATLIPNAELVIVHGGDHMLGQTRAREVAEAICAFLAR